MPDFSIVLVCWNNKDYMDKCLASLYSEALRYSYEVIVVDNGSTDGSQEMLAQKYPQVILIENNENLGLGKASNQGIEISQGRYILLLNNDTIVNGQSFDTMVQFMEENANVGAVGGKLLNPDGTVQACYNDFPSLKEEFLIATRLGELLWKGYPGNIAADEKASVDWLGSACLLLRKKALDQVGVLDEGFFIYGDEVDLLFRIKRRGWINFFLPEVTTIHYGGRSMDRWRRRKMVYRGKMMFFRKNYGVFRLFLLRLLFTILSLAKLLVWGGAFLLPGQRDRARKEMNSNIEVLQLCLYLS